MTRRGEAGPARDRRASSRAKGRAPGYELWMYIAMNHFRVAPDRCEDFERGWRERESYLNEVPGYVSFNLLKGPEEDGARLYASHTVWKDEAAFKAWTESEAFHKAHRRAGGAVGVMLGPPRFIGWQAVI